MINPCCCGSCCVFTDEFTGSAISGQWTSPTNLTIDTVLDNAELAANTSVGVTADLADGNGYLEVSFQYPPTPDKLIIRGAFKDSNNHWRLELWIDDYPGTYPGGDCLFAALYEVVAGADTYCGTRFQQIGVEAGANAKFCYYEGQVMEVQAKDMVFTFPMHVLDGTTFELEAGDSPVIIEYAKLCKNKQDDPTCFCVPETCVQCVDELNDTWQVEIMSGPDVGLTFVLDRYLDWIAYPPTYGLQTSLYSNYWRWFYIGEVSGDPDDYEFELDLCVDGLGDSTGQFAVIHDPNSIFGSGSVNFTMADCVGPFDVTFNSVDYRLTPL